MGCMDTRAGPPGKHSAQVPEWTSAQGAPGLAGTAGTTPGRSRGEGVDDGRGRARNGRHRWPCSGYWACGSSKPPVPTSPISAKSTATGVLGVCGKQIKIVLIPLPPTDGRAIGDRASGSILLKSPGARMDRHAATRCLRRLAQAGGSDHPAASAHAQAYIRHDHAGGRSGPARRADRRPARRPAHHDALWLLAPYSSLCRHVFATGCRAAVLHSKERQVGMAPGGAQRSPRLIVIYGSIRQRTKAKANEGEGGGEGGGVSSVG